MSLLHVQSPPNAHLVEAAEGIANVIRRVRKSAWGEAAARHAHVTRALRSAFGDGNEALMTDGLDGGKVGR